MDLDREHVIAFVSGGLGDFAVIDRLDEARVDQTAFEESAAPLRDRQVHHIGHHVDTRHQSAGEAVAAGNRVIVDLGPDDFVITERGQAREILDARVADYPVVVLIDTGAAARESFEDIRRAVERFVTRLGQRPVAIATLGDPSAAIARLDDERSVVLDRLRALTPNPESTVPVPVTV